MMHITPFPRFLATLTMCCLATLLHAQNLPGFSATSAQTQLLLEKELQKIPEPATFKAHLTALTKAPHPAGSAANEQVRDYMVQQMEEAGFSVELFPYDVYLPKDPGQNSVALVRPIRLPLNNKEYILAEDRFSDHPDLSHGWNSFSGSGDVTAEVVYVNYGTKEDFEQLAELGVSLEGKIAIARYGGNFRGYKAKYAEAAGAIGLIIYTDPKDSGYTKGLPYPQGPYANESTIQRGSLLTLDYTGDPLTPFTPALPQDGKKQAKRLSPSEVPFHTIPVTPLPFASAREILSRMEGDAVPSQWQGGLPFTYRVQGGPGLHVRLKVAQEYGLTRIYNVVGTLEGSEFPDEWVLMGAHYDAWDFGAIDPNSGTAMLLTLADALGELKKQGSLPKRTIKIGHWDAEEHGIIGSTEWVEHYRKELEEKAVAYLNADAVVGGLRFGMSSSPSLKSLAINASKEVAYPTDAYPTIYDYWMDQAPAGAEEPSVGNLGGGSDHLGFYVHTGIPSLGGGFGDRYPYHSTYDNMAFYERFADPDFVAGPALSKLFGIMSLRLANAEILPYDFERYATDFNSHHEGIRGMIADFYEGYQPEALLASLSELEAQTQKTAEKLLKLATESPNKSQLRKINQALIKLEKAFIDDEGMPYGRWYRSLYASSDPYSGYASWMLPGYRYEIANKKSDKLSQWDGRYQKALERLTRELAAIEAL